jgi:zinc/manganese transport system permease protein
MMLELLFDPLFRVPFLTGLLLAPLAGLLGAYLRLREEWLASLAYAQVAAAGGVLSVLLHVAVVPAAIVTAGVAAALKALLQRAGNDHFGLMIILGWSIALLVAANSAHGEMIGKALMDGQLYFTGATHLTAALLLVVAASALLPWLSPRLLLVRFFPDHFAANGLPAWRHHLGFDLLVVLTVAVTTTSMGVMAAFALVFMPAWIAFRLAIGWRRVLVIATGLALGSYVLAFVLAIVLDQPFGPVLVLVLGLLGPLRYLQPTQYRTPAPGTATRPAANS